MKSFRFTLTVLALAFVGSLKVTSAADVIIEPSEAEKDAGFQTQGEYTGEFKVEDKSVKIGVQVIAQGDDKFNAVAYPGGLPGDGWDGKKKLTGSGELKDGVARFQGKTPDGKEGTGAIQDGVLTVTDADGNLLGKLKKVIRKSTTLGLEPPKGATVLFAGSADAWDKGKTTKDGLLIQGTRTKDTFGSFQLHVEFRLSYTPKARGQGRSNSGCYMQARYEVQILDSFGLSGEHNECGGIYSVKKPDLNMCYPPLSWQTYDVDFTAAKFDDAGKKTANARMTVKHNGVVIHDNIDVPKSTTASPLKEGAGPGPIYLQDHGNPIRFRNIWLVPKP
ncbi:MAG: DUF1080 domain-containing protein [Planctomycetota bacterium]|nr:DUF1080 domain-containing protein [Planctomycetota bacterium]